LSGRLAEISGQEALQQEARSVDEVESEAELGGLGPPSREQL